MSKGNRQYSVEAGGISVGFILAALLSWQHNHDIIWAIIHGILSWFYVIYYALHYT